MSRARPQRRGPREAGPATLIVAVVVLVGLLYGIYRITIGRGPTGLHRGKGGQVQMGDPMRAMRGEFLKKAWVGRDQFKCPGCGKILATPGEFMAHVGEQHPELLPKELQGQPTPGRSAGRGAR